MTSSPLRNSAAWPSWAVNTGLILVTLIWGSTFVLVKDVVASMPVMSFLGWRFVLASVALLPFSFRGLRHATRREWLAGLALGGFLFAGFFLQTLGLRYTTASNAGFITSLYIPLAPLLAWPLVRHRPGRSALMALLVALVGLALLSLPSSLSINLGDSLEFLCALAFAGQVAFIGFFASRMNALTLAQVQISTVAVAAVAAALIGGEPLASMPSGMLGVVLYAGVIATALALWLQVAMQGKTSVTQASLVFVAEPVFAALFAWLLAGETLHLRGWLGAAMILGGMALGQRGEREPTQHAKTEESANATAR